jgi:hypothetical protein
VDIDLAHRQLSAQFEARGALYGAYNGKVRKFGHKVLESSKCQELYNALILQGKTALF